MDPQALVRKANQMTNTESFRSCFIYEQGRPLILAYEFDSGPNAAAFKNQREPIALTIGCLYKIDNETPNGVLEQRR
jgi:hypothetical protein